MGPNLTRPTFRSIDRFFDFLSEKKHSDRNSLPRGVVPRPKRRGESGPGPGLGSVESFNPQHGPRPRSEAALPAQGPRRAGRRFEGERILPFFLQIETAEALVLKKKKKKKK